MNNSSRPKPNLVPIKSSLEVSEQFNTDHADAEPVKGENVIRLQMDPSTEIRDLHKQQQFIGIEASNKTSLSLRPDAISLF
jgi:hypothetical protein